MSVPQSRSSVSGLTTTPPCLCLRSADALGSPIPSLVPGPRQRDSAAVTIAQSQFCFLVPLLSAGRPSWGRRGGQGCDSMGISDGAGACVCGQSKQRRTSKGLAREESVTGGPPPPMPALRPGNQAWSPSFSDIPLYHLLSHTVYTDPSQLLMATLTVSLTRKPVFWVSRPRKCWGTGNMTAWHKP